MFTSPINNGIPGAPTRILNNKNLQENTTIEDLQFYNFIVSITLIVPTVVVLRVTKTAAERQNNTLFLCSVDRASQYIRVIKTNLMHSASSVYFVNHSLYWHSEDRAS